MPLRKVFALADPSAWNSPPPDICAAHIFTRSGSWLTCHFLSDVLPVHPFQNDNSNTFISSALPIPLPLFYFYSLVFIPSFPYFICLSSASPNRIEALEGCDSFVDCTQGCLSRNSVSVCQKNDFLSSYLIQHHVYCRYLKCTQLIC